MIKYFKDKLIRFKYGFLNWFIVTATNGYFGDVHIAINYSHFRPYFPPPIYAMYLQASREGVKLKVKESEINDN